MDTRRATIEFIEMVEANIASIQRDLALHKANNLSPRALAHRTFYNAKWAMEAAEDLKAQFPK
jgi:hypothetical protein